MKKIYIKDNNGDDFLIENIEKFKNHLIKYHSINNEGDYSIHEENGKYFTVTKKFFKHIKSL